MKQKITMPFSEKLNYVVISLFCFGTPFFMFLKFGFENKQKSLLIISIFLFSLGMYSIFKIVKISKSTFVLCNLPYIEKESIIYKLAEERYFKTLTVSKDNLIRLHYQKYALGLDYEIPFFIDQNQIEFNVFCNRSGIIDFGTRKRLIKHIKDKIEFNCASL